MKVICIYPGRFQPFVIHHKLIYDKLKKEFGNDVYIATSNKVDIAMSPFDFIDKKKIINSFGIKNVNKVKSPYISSEILDKFDPKDTAVVFVLGQKDYNRLKSTKKQEDGLPWFIPYDKGNIKYTFDRHAYVYIAPLIKLKIPGYGYMSGTNVRKVFQDLDINESKRKELFIYIFGKFNIDIYKLLKYKISNVREAIDEFISNDFKSIINEVSKGYSSGAIVDDGPGGFYGNKYTYEKNTKEFAEKLGMMVVDYLIPDKELENFAFHVYPGGPIGDVSFFETGVGGMGIKDRDTQRMDFRGNKAYKMWKKYIKKVAQVSGYKILNNLDSVQAIEDSKDIGTIDLFFELLDKKINPKIGNKVWWTKELQNADLLTNDIDIKKASKTSKTSIKEYKTSILNTIKPVCPIDNKYSKEWWDEQLILEGIASGHMSHPFEDNNLTFGDFKELIDKSLNGNLALERDIGEKVDGQNLLITWKDNKLKAARNKTQRKDPIGISQVMDMFKGRGEIRNAFVYAMQDLDKAISALPVNKREDLFNNGKNFMNLEILYPQNRNVINYDISAIQFHTLNQYDINGNIIGSSKEGAYILKKMIDDANQSVQKRFKIIEPNVLKINKNKDFSIKKLYFLNKLIKLQNKFNLKDINTLGDYHYAWWQNFISQMSKNYILPNNLLIILINRWAFMDKSYSLTKIKKEIKDEKFLMWILNFDKNDHKKQLKVNILPFENLFLELGSEVLKNIHGFLAGNPDKVIQDLRNDIAKIIKQLRLNGDITQLEKMNTQLEKIKTLGGFKNIIPAEGIVFQFKGKLYKYSALFSPLNQIMGIMRYSR